MPDNALVRKLGRFLDMTVGEKAAVESWCEKPLRYRARQILVKEGDRTEHAHIFLSGWSYRFVDTRSGKRQTVGFLLPGDMADGHAALLRSADHSIAALSDATVACVSAQRILRSVEDHPRLGQALWWSAQLDEGILRHWLVNVGRRDAVTRTAYLLCELWVRAQTIGLIVTGRIAMPLTQQDLAEALGLTSVHMNRTLQALRESKLIIFQQRELAIPSFDALARLAGFDPTYLQLEQRSE